jgi:hypothetical protein
MFIYYVKHTNNNDETIYLIVLLFIFILLFVFVFVWQHLPWDRFFDIKLIFYFTFSWMLFTIFWAKIVIINFLSLLHFFLRSVLTNLDKLHTHFLTGYDFCHDFLIQIKYGYDTFWVTLYKSSSKQSWTSSRGGSLWFCYKFNLLVVIALLSN